MLFGHLLVRLRRSQNAVKHKGCLGRHRLGGPYGGGNRRSGKIPSREIPVDGAGTQTSNTAVPVTKYQRKRPECHVDRTCESFKDLKGLESDTWLKKYAHLWYIKRLLRR